MNDLIIIGIVILIIIIHLLDFIAHDIVEIIIISIILLISVPVVILLNCQKFQFIFIFL